MKTLKELGLRVPEILLPANTDLNKWSVIACDQYTQDKEYWKKAEAAAGDGPSTLNLILPEVYLNSPDKPERIEKIRQTMKEYLRNRKSSDYFKILGHLQFSSREQVQSFFDALRYGLTENIK